MDKIKAIVSIIKNWDNEKIIRAWNNYCADECMEDYIHGNDEYFFEEMFEKADEAVSAVCFGNYRYQDDYVVFNAYGNLDTFDYWDEEKSPIDLNILAEYMADNGDCDNEIDTDELEDLFIESIIESNSDIDAEIARNIIDALINEEPFDFLTDDWTVLIEEVLTEYNKENFEDE